MRWPACAVIALMLALLGPAPAAAQADDSEQLFTVFGIEVDVTATTAAQARRIALGQARREALRLLVDKLAAPESWPALPPLSDAELEQMVRAMQISNERTSPTRYLAEIDVTFSPTAMRDLFAEAGVAYTESLGGPYLLLPLYEASGRLTLLGEHPWRAALAAARPENRLIRYRFPDDRLRSRVLLSPQRLDAAGPATLGEVARRFEVSDALLVHARPTVDFATGRRAVAFRALTGPEGGVSVGDTVIAREEEDLPALLERAADSIFRSVDEAWKARTLVSDLQRREMAVLAPVRDLDDWIALQERLDTVAILRESEIERIALPLSRLSLSYVGSEEQLALALAQARLVLEGEGEMRVLRPREQAEALAKERAEKEADKAREGAAGPGPDGGDQTPPEAAESPPDEETAPDRPDDGTGEGA